MSGMLSVQLTGLCLVLFRFVSSCSALEAKRLSGF